MLVGQLTDPVTASSADLQLVSCNTTANVRMPSSGDMLTLLANHLVTKLVRTFTQCASSFMSLQFVKSSTKETSTSCFSLNWGKITNMKTGVCIIPSWSAVVMGGGYFVSDSVWVACAGHWTSRWTPEPRVLWSMTSPLSEVLVLWLISEDSHQCEGPNWC